MIDDLIRIDGVEYVMVCRYIGTSEALLPAPGFNLKHGEMQVKLEPKRKPTGVICKICLSPCVVMSTAKAWGVCLCPKGKLPYWQQFYGKVDE